MESKEYNNSPLDSTRILFSSEDIQSIYGIGKSTVEQWRLRGCGPRFIRLDGSRLIRYRREDILEHIGDQIPVSSTSEADIMRLSI